MTVETEELVDMLREVLSYHGIPVETVEAVDGKRIVIELAEVEGG